MYTNLSTQTIGLTFLVSLTTQSALHYNTVMIHLIYTPSHTLMASTTADGATSMGALTIHVRTQTLMLQHQKWFRVHQHPKEYPVSDLPITGVFYRPDFGTP